MLNIKVIIMGAVGKDHFCALSLFLLSKVVVLAFLRLPYRFDPLCMV